MNAALTRTRTLRTQRGLSGLAIGCLVAVGAFIAIVGVVGYLGYSWYTGIVADYTDDEPVELPTVDWSEEEVAEVEARVRAFADSIERGETPEELVLSADEINAMIASNEELRGRVFVTVEDGQIGGQVSIPLDALPAGQGRYLNADAAFDVSMVDGVLDVRLTAANVRGAEIPEAVIAAIGNENLGQELQNDPETREILQRFESITIEGNQIVLTPRVGDANEAQ